MKKKTISRLMSDLGKLGAAARTKSLSVERRKEIASNASKARWNNKVDHEDYRIK